MKCLFLSDAHYPLCGDEFVDFLLNIYGIFDRIYLLGDIFEFYFGYDDFFYNHHIKVINVINILSSRSKVFMFEGNHEYELRVFKNICDVEIVDDFLIDDLDDNKIYMTHGDRIDKHDLAYRLFRSSLKNPIMLYFIKYIDPYYLLKLSKRASNFSKGTLKKKSLRRVEHLLFDFAKNQLMNNLDIVIMAHTHLSRKEELSNGMYINIGSFLNNRNFLTYDSSCGFTFYENGEQIWTMSKKK